MLTSSPPRGPRPTYSMQRGMNPSPTSTLMGWAFRRSRPPRASAMSRMLFISGVSCVRVVSRPEVVSERGLQLRPQVEAVQGEELLPDCGEAAVRQDQTDSLGHLLGVPRQVRIEV